MRQPPGRSTPSEPTDGSRPDHRAAVRGAGGRGQGRNWRSGMKMDNDEIVHLLGIGLTWEGIQREAERRKLEYRRPCCCECGAELSIEEVVRDAAYCYSCEKRVNEEARRRAEESGEGGIWSKDPEETTLYGVASLARLLPMPWLVGVGLAVAAAFGLARSHQSSRREAVQAPTTPLARRESTSGPGGHRRGHGSPA
jgi:hypothetical protein